MLTIIADATATAGALTESDAQAWATLITAVAGAVATVLGVIFGHRRGRASERRRQKGKGKA